MTRSATLPRARFAAGSDGRSDEQKRAEEIIAPTPASRVRFRFRDIQHPGANISRPAPRAAIAWCDRCRRTSAANSVALAITHGRIFSQGLEHDRIQITTQATRSLRVRRLRSAATAPSSHDPRDFVVRRMGRRKFMRFLAAQHFVEQRTQGVNITRLGDRGVRRFVRGTRRSESAVAHSPP